MSVAEYDKPDTGDTGGTVWDAPNQEVVGVGPPWEEGTGGDPGALAEETDAESGSDLSTMTKAELLAEAEARGVEADDSMTKAEIVAAIEASE